jgi:hypothetical protein
MIPFLYLIGLGSKCKNNKISFLCLENRITALNWYNEALREEARRDGKWENRAEEEI